MVVVEIKDKETDGYEYIVAEVKNSTRKKTVKRGIKEGMEYLAFMKKDGEFVYGEKVFEKGEGNGLVVVQDFEERETLEFDEQKGPVRVLEVSELEKKLNGIFKNI